MILDIYCDGASRSNPGEASVGVSIIQENVEIKAISRKIGIATNNVAEYQALIDGLQYCNDNNIQSARFYLDSKLVVEQIVGNFKVKSEHLKELHGHAKALIFKIENFTIEHVYRQYNKRADELANLALDK